MSIRHTTAAAVIASAILCTLHATSAGPFVEDGNKHVPGIYLAAPGQNGAEEQVRLPGSRPHEVKTTGLGKMILTQGLLKGSMVFELAGNVADLRTAALSPTFYFYFDTDPAQPGGDPMAMMSQMMTGDAMPVGAKTAAEFSLIHLSLTDGNRQANMGKVGGMSSKPKDTVECTQERLAQGVYRVQPKSPLKPGEYAFVFTNSMGGSMSSMWDFGIDPPKQGHQPFGLDK
jgi:hypothetical protein